VLSWTEATELLDTFEIDVHPTVLATDVSEAVEAATDFGFPVVLKIDSRDVPHRTDADAVRVEVDNTGAVKNAYETIIANTRKYAPDARIEGILVQPHIEDGVEALVGATRDDVFGPVVTVGSGGVSVELYDDTAVRIAPLSNADAHDAVLTTTLAEQLNGHRSEPSRDLATLTSLINRVGRLATVVDDVAEVDLNPVIVQENDISVVDVLVKTN
jgi:acetyltransferase